MGVIFVHFDLVFRQILGTLYSKKRLNFIHIAFWLGACALADVFCLLNSSTSLRRVVKTDRKRPKIGKDRVDVARICMIA